MPAVRRFYVDSKQGLGQDLVLDGAEHKHLSKVLRLLEGSEIIVICGDEFDYYYKITEIAKSHTRLVLAGKKPNLHNPHKHLTVYIGVIKHDNLALTVEKLNEIGVSEVVLFKSARCQNIPIKLDKLQAIANQSCKQCGRSIPLKVSGVLTFKEMLSAIPESTLLADATLRAVGRQSSEANAIIIGPEGGFIELERTQIRNVTAPISLGARTLRVETAAIVGAAILLQKMGEL